MRGATPAMFLACQIHPVTETNIYRGGLDAVVLEAIVDDRDGDGAASSLVVRVVTNARHNHTMGQRTGMASFTGMDRGCSWW